MFIIECCLTVMLDVGFLTERKGKLQKILTELRRNNMKYAFSTYSY
jgi:hypothetical protein